MTSSTVLDRIAAWEADGVIDAATAQRLREVERARDSSPIVADDRASEPSTVRSTFGPAPTVAEVLGYVGGGFVLAAWYVLMSTQRLVGDATWQVWVVTFGVAAAVAIGAASLVRDIGDRGPRATSVLLALATVNVFGAAYQVAVGLSLGSSEELVVGSIAALGVALLVRRWQPGLVTQGVLLASIATLAATGGSLMKARLLGPSMPVSNVGELAMDLALWLFVALAFGWLGLRESSVGTVEAGRRAALSRFAAGATAVVATAAILTRSGPVGMDRWDRLVEPVVADVAIAVLSIGLLWLALRRGTAAYLYPAALGIIIALTDLNASYVADQVGTGVALLLEGSLIIAAGFMADRIRRRLRVA